MSRILHVLSDSDDLTIGLFLRDMMLLYGLEKVRLEMCDHGSLVDELTQRPPKGIGLLDLVVRLNAQAIIPFLDILYERRRGGKEYLKISLRLVVSGSLMRQRGLHSLISIHDLLLKVKTEVKLIEHIVRRRAIDHR